MTTDRDAVYDAIRMRILSGADEPGSHLAEAQISENFGVSRTPVRAALRRLAEEGLVKLEPHRGAFVATYTRADVEEVFEIRRMLEGRAAALAAARRSPSQIAALNQSVLEMVEIADSRRPEMLQELHNNNRGFHELVLTAAASPRLSHIVRKLAQTSVTLGTFFSYSEQDVVRSVRAHEDIADAIASRHAQLASELMSVHLGLAQKIFLRTHFPETSHQEN